MAAVDVDQQPSQGPARRGPSRSSLCLLGVLLAAALRPAAADPPPRWSVLQPGVEYGVLHPPGAPEDAFHVVRVDPTRARLVAAMATARDRRPRSAGAWCEQERLLAAINLGMYLDDHLRNVGYARAGPHLNQPRWNPKYRSVLVFGPRRHGLPAAAIIDVDTEASRRQLDDYHTVVQNLRLIRAPGESVWSAQPRRWSETAVAIDRQGRVLFVFARAPHTMADFNRILLALPLGVSAAMHVEGGPEASLSLRGRLRLDLNGSYETGFIENDGETAQWPIPNVLGVAER